VRFSTKSFGCAYNNAETDALRQLLAAAGFRESSPATAGVLIYNTCSVKQNTQDKILSEIARCRKPLVVTGCLAQANPELVHAANPRAIILPIESHAQLPQAIRAAVNNKPFKARTAKRLAGATVNGGIARIRIAQGCAGSCTYCLTRLARGRIQSVPLTVLRKEVEDAVARGAVEIQLCSQDAGAYGLDNGSSLAELIDAVSSVPGGFKIRVGMLNPDRAPPELWKHYNDKVFKFLHLPLQSASDKVLRDMRRNYDYAGFKRVLAGFRKAFPEGLVATDVIAGYPTETEEDFRETLAALEESRFAVVNVSKFSSRPGTAAALLEKLPSKTVKQRSSEAAKLANRVTREVLAGLVGKEFDCVVTERGSKGGFMCRTDGYYPILLKRAKIGGFIRVRAAACKGVTVYGIVAPSARGSPRIP